MKYATAALLFALALPLRAAGVELGIQHVATMMTGDGAYEGGVLDVETARGFGVNVELFLSEKLSTQLGATFINPVAIINPGDVDLNTISLDIYSLTARYHVAPRSRLSAFAGGGAAYVSLGNLEERFADNIELRFDPQTTVVVEAGLRYRFRPRLAIVASLAYMPLEAESIVIRDERPDVALPPLIALDPLTLSVGASWRF